MRGFEVYLNGKRLCVAGIGDDGVLTAILDHVARGGRHDLHLRVGGLLSSTKEHVTWQSRQLKSGDQVRVKVVEAATIDEPAKRERQDPNLILNAEKDYVRNAAQKFGWQLIEDPAKKKRTRPSTAKRRSRRY
jgi:hypothetical protein